MPAPTRSFQSTDHALRGGVLVTGATGTLGSQVVASLRSEVPVRALVRDVDRGRAVLGRDVSLVQGDLDDSASLDQAVQGVDRVFLLCPHGDQQADQAQLLAAAARAAGVERVVFLSSAAADDPEAPLGGPHRAAEQTLTRSGISWTALRPTMAGQSLVEVASRFLRPDGTLGLPLGDARFNPVDARDIAAAATALLLSDSPIDPAYLLTGPGSVTGSDLAAVIGSATDRPATYRDIPLEDFTGALTAGGAPPEIAEHATMLFGYFRSGGLDRVSTSVQRLTGRQPRSLSELSH